MSIDDYINRQPLESLKGAYLLLEGINEANKEGMHIYTNEANELLECLFKDSIVELEKILEKKISQGIE